MLCAQKQSLLLASHPKLSVVLLPGLAMAPEPEDPHTIVKVRGGFGLLLPLLLLLLLLHLLLHLTPCPPSPPAFAPQLASMAALFGARCMPSLHEYCAINLKATQFQRARIAGLPVVPYEVLSMQRGLPPAVDSLRAALRSLRSQLDGLGAGPHAEPGAYMLKPVVGACGASRHVLRILLLLPQPDPAAGPPPKRAKKAQAQALAQALAQAPDADAEPTDAQLHALAASFAAHALLHPRVREWLLQPFLPRLPLAEYKVFVGGDPADALVAYCPLYENGLSSVVFCDDGHLYSDLFGFDGFCPHPGPLNAPLAEDLVAAASKTWECRALHDAIVAFARRCRGAFADASAFDAECIADVLCRADVVCLLPKAGADDPAREKKDGGVTLDAARPLLLLNEMDNLWSASLLVDLVNPRNDGIAALATPTPAPAQRTPTQARWAIALRRRIIACVLGAAADAQVNWGAAGRAIPPCHGPPARARGQVQTL